MENGRFVTRLYWYVWMDHPELARGYQTMLQIRCGEWKAGDVDWSSLSIRNRNRICPCCECEVEETLRHHLCECDSFKSERDEMVSWVKAELIKKNVQDGIVD